jgi:hypothetical protein
MDGSGFVASPKQGVEDFIRYTLGLFLDIPEEMDWDQADEFLLRQLCVIWSAKGRPESVITFRPEVKGESRLPVARLVDVANGEAHELTFEQYEQSGRRVSALSC